MQCVCVCVCVYVLYRRLCARAARGENNFIALFSLFRALKVRDDGCVIKLPYSAQAPGNFIYSPFPCRARKERERERDFQVYN